MSEQVQVVLVADHPYVVDGLTRTLRSRGFAVTGTAGSTAEALDAIGSRKPNVALVDIMVGSRDTLELITAAREASPATAVLVSIAATTQEVVGAIDEAGAAGLVSKLATVDELVAALQAAAKGEPVRDERVALALQRRTTGTELTSREREILTRLAQGLSTDEIADELFLARHTVHTHVRNAIQRKGARNRVHAVALAAAEGEIHLPQPE